MLIINFADLVPDVEVPIPANVINSVVVTPEITTFVLATLTKEPGKDAAVETPIKVVPTPTGDTFNPSLSKL